MRFETIVISARGRIGLSLRPLWDIIKAEKGPFTQKVKKGKKFLEGYLGNILWF